MHLLEPCGVDGRPFVGFLDLEHSPATIKGFKVVLGHIGEDAGIKTFEGFLNALDLLFQSCNFGLLGYISGQFLVGQDEFCGRFFVLVDVDTAFLFGEEECIHLFGRHGRNRH